MEHADLAQAAALVGALGAVLVLAVPARAAVAGGLAVLGAAEGMLVWSLVPRSDLAAVTASPARIAAVVAAAIVLAALAAALALRPALAPPLLLAAAPFRIPVDVGEQEALLLVPLYAVLAAAGLALAYRAVRDRGLPALPPVLAIPAAAFIGLAAVSLLWSVDVRAGSIQLVFFLLPFAVLVAAVARAPLAPWLPRALAGVLVGLAAVFAAIGLWQAATHRLFFSPTLEVANAYTTFFRVNSLFKDPSLYGRHLVLAVAVLLVVLWRGRIRLPIGAAIIGLLAAGLYFSYSQSSFVTLFVAALAATLLAADRRSKQIAAVAAALAVFAAGAIAATRDESARRLTHDRSRLVSITAGVFESNPLVGVGVGGQTRASSEEAGRQRTASRDASHTTPLTVAAELGAVGIVAYLAFLGGAALLLAAARRRDETTALALAVVFLALLVHSLVYSGFFEDPLTWGSLAVAAAAVAAAPQPVRLLRWPRAAPSAPQRDVPAQNP